MYDVEMMAFTLTYTGMFPDIHVCVQRVDKLLCENE